MESEEFPPPDSTVFHRDYHGVVKLIWMPEAGIEFIRREPFIRFQVYL